ncbi:MAG: NeuD/PglB/VioB family sugar acetyltransferase [Candidatus Marinarcus sp.]|uniref:NeuD/PglB/VioB family sugar acetyltransferase n=1 Tax=Candidatus Marinarcus sp. TaxID=3100987 RepID=UPI003B0045F0
MKKISIIGAGGHTRSSLNLLKTHFSLNQLTIYDETYSSDTKELIQAVPVVGKITNIPKESLVFLSIGDNTKRESLFHSFRNSLIQDSLTHPTTYIEEGVKIGMANQIFAHVYINSNSSLGDNNIINSGAILEHEVTVGHHNHISVGARLCGRVTLGSRCFVGASATIIDKVSVCDDVIIGAGAVVTNNITQSGTYVGVPARKIK